MTRERLARLTSATAVAAVSLISLAAGIALWLGGRHQAADVVWAALIVALLVPLGWSVIRTLLRGDVGVDAIALIAMGGALVLQEYLAGAVIALMLAGGNALEERAGRRARRELTALVSRAPRRATRVVGDSLLDVDVDEIVPGDLVLVRSGEVVPTDGVLDDDEAVIDESALTGEALPVVFHRGQALRSGTVSSGTARIRATRRAADSAYAAIVRLARDAERQRAPFVRMADRYAAFFLPVTAAVAAAAWAASGDPVRALAVFVVATPCPLILAAPIALISGVSRAARLGIVVKGGGVIERLGGARTVVVDKTGTVTLGTPQLTRIGSLDGIGESEALRLAASADLVSLHPYAAALVRAAHDRGLTPALPGDAVEQPGQGVAATIEGRRVAVGSDGFLRGLGIEGLEELDGSLAPGDARALLGVDGRLAAWFELTDPPREGSLELAARLRAEGVVHLAMLTGDRAAVAERVGTELGVDRIYAEQTPADKLAVVEAIKARPGLAPLVMVGDGINDAPALALADVGIAMGSTAASASSEAADAVVLVDRVDRVADAIGIGRRSLAIARQSVVAGMALSLGAMAVAALGYLTPVAGAVYQEAVDVAVILNALRALRG